MNIIICGAGQVGLNLAKYLAQRDHDVTVIDNDAELIDEINDTSDVKAICGHASHPDILELASAKDADLLVAVTYQDEVNMIACEVARALFNVPKLIARVREQAYLMPKWQDLYSAKNLNIDYLISPEIEVAHVLSRNLFLPGAFEAYTLADEKIYLLGIRLTQSNPLINTPISHIHSLFQQIPFTVIGVRRGDDAFLPHHNEVLQVGDEVYVIVPKDETLGLLKAFGFNTTEKRQRLTIIGGGNIGLRLALDLEESNAKTSIQIIERDPERAEWIAQQLKHALVICGDGLDADILKEVGIDHSDTVVAVTDNEKSNCLTALLAKRMGAQKTLALNNQSNFGRLVTSLGVDAVVSPKVITVSNILQYIRKGQLRKIYSLGENFCEIIEVDASMISGVVGSKVSEIEKSGKLLIPAVFRDQEVLVTNPNSIIKLEDRVIMVLSSDYMKSHPDIIATLS